MEGSPHGYEYMEQGAWHRDMLLRACPTSVEVHVAGVLAQYETQHMNCLLVTHKDKAHMIVHTCKENDTQSWVLIILQSWPNISEGIIALSPLDLIHWYLGETNPRWVVHDTLWVLGWVVPTMVFIFLNDVFGYLLGGH